MTIRVAINGFGRIGRAVFRTGWDDSAFEVVHINDLTNDDMLAYLLEHDSVHGLWSHSVEAVEGGLSIDGKLVATSAERDPAKLPWAEKQVDVVLECTGRFRARPQANLHIEAGAKKVIISAPATDPDGTFCVGVNDHLVDPSKHHIVSNASCTTNCLSPMAKVLHENFGIKQGLMTTVHSYTMDQNLLDGPHKDFRRARAAAVNMVPTSTGAAKAVSLVLPELEGRLNGMAIRVPTPNVSLVDLVFTSEKPMTVDAINAAITSAANGELKGILKAETKPVVSGDLMGNPHSSIVDLDQTLVSGAHMAKVLSWYDNEWGFSNRMIDLTRILSGLPRR